MDEDCAAYESWVAELELRGYQVTVLRSANDAWNLLWKTDVAQIELAIIDVMLAVEDTTDSRFSHQITDGYLEAGLRLLENLAEQNGSAFPRRAALLTNTLNEKTLGAAHRVSKQFEIPLWDKRRIMSPMEFGDIVQDAINGRKQ